MSWDCSCDYESPTVYRSSVVRAKKLYRCDECGARIELGEQHEYVFGVCDGYPYQPRTCLHCVGIRKFVSLNFPCFCWAHGNLHEDIQSAVDYAYGAAPDEVRGVKFGIGRRLIARKRAHLNRVPTSEKESV